MPVSERKPVSPRRPAIASALGLFLAATAAACTGRRGAEDAVPTPVGADSGIVRVDGPILIGFHPRLTRAAMRDSAAARRLGDFRAGLAHLRDAFERAGVRVYEQYTDTLALEEPGRGLQIYVPPPDSGIGYYLAAPGRDPEVLHGLRSEVEIRDAAWRYFHDRGGARRASRGAEDPPSGSPGYS